MTTFTLLLALLTTPVQAPAQDAAPPDGARVESTEVSGFDRDQLSPGLRRDIDALVGQPLNRERTRQLAARIEAERPDVVAAVRIVARPADEARIMFLVAQVDDGKDLPSNVNARYIVESVEISGVPETRVSQPLRDRMQRLVGNRLDPDETDRLDGLLKEEFREHDVGRRIARGMEPGQVRVVFTISETPWIPYTPSRGKIVYHTTQGFTGVLDIPLDIAGDNVGFRVNVSLPFRNFDDLVEKYSGYRVRFEARRIETRRFGAGIELSSLNQTWKPETLSALASNPSLPEAYRHRWTIEPFATVAFNARLRVTGSLSFSDLESLSRSPLSERANTATAAIGFDQRWEGTVTNDTLNAGYQVRRGVSALGSDLVYTRHEAQTRYRHQHGGNVIQSALLVGHITGNAPLFERFTLGDSATLRGWHKLDLTPAGGERVIHHSLEYRYKLFAVFLDSGSVWQRGDDAKLRLATGVGLHGDDYFWTLAFPLNDDKIRPTFMVGMRFSPVFRFVRTP